jgi:hypothetical protein
MREDYPKEIEDRRKQLLPVLSAAINAGHNAYVIVDKLHIDFKDNGGHRVFDVHTISSLPDDLHPQNISSRKTDNCLAFFTEFNPLSNFHKCNLVIGNCTYHSVEQYYQLAKAKSACDDDACKRILEAVTPSNVNSLEIM